MGFIIGTDTTTKYAHISIDDRIIIDRLAYKHNNSSVHNRSLIDFSKKKSKLVTSENTFETEGSGWGDEWAEGKAKPDHPEEPAEESPLSALTPNQLMLCVPTVYGYSLKAKRWLEFHVERITPIKFNDTAFQSFALPADQKDSILALVESQVENKESFDDVIQGRGKGVIMLLSGGPGIGKTCKLKCQENISYLGLIYELRRCFIRS